MKTKATWLALAVAALALAAPVQANAPRVTRGDAQAILEAFENGGWAVFLHGEVVEGAPADFRPDSLARIYALGANGKHHCSLDWHVINVAAIEGNVEGGSRTTAEIHDFLSRTKLTFTLDGAPLETTRTAIKRFLNPELRGLVEAWWVSEGQVLAPDKLSIGQHTIQFTGQRPGRPPNVMPAITFFIDAAGEGACL
jgi:hypothetical protein